MNIKGLYETDDNAKALFNWAANRERDTSMTTVDTLSHKLGISRRDAIGLGQKLDSLGCGRFVVGRRGQKSRILWSFGLRSLGQAAKGETDKLEETEADSGQDQDLFVPESDSTRIEHRFQLRPEVAVTLKLPEDLTRKEAERLATFIQSLPFDG